MQYERREEVCQDLKAKIGPENVSKKIADRVSSSHGFWMIAENWTVEGTVPSLPDLVVWPTETGDIVDVLEYANEEEIPVIPYGGGSGVLGGLAARNGGISLDLKRMNELLNFEEENLRVDVQAGMNGMVFEDRLKQKGYTTGHSPQSLYCSSVGGWVATKATGQFSTKYGGIENMLLGLEAVLPSGKVIKSDFSPRRSAGPEISPLFVGSEGILGVISEISLKIHPEPEGRFLISYAFDTIEEALRSVKKVMRSDLTPAVIRIYDEVETKRHFNDFLDSGSKVITVFIIEGNRDVAKEEKNECKEICSELGEYTGDEPVRHWVNTRFNVTETSQLPLYGIVFDTIEASIGWKNAVPFYRNAIDSLESVEGVLLASAHASHFYPQGVCFYFTFGGVPPEDKTPLQFYQEAWEAAVGSFLEDRGHISHHHGIGINRSSWFSEERKNELEMLRKIKRSVDPNNIMNPELMNLVEGES